MQLNRFSGSGILPAETGSDSGMAAEFVDGTSIPGMAWISSPIIAILIAMHLGDDCTPAYKGKQNRAMHVPFTHSRAAFE